LTIKNKNGILNSGKENLTKIGEDRIMKIKVLERKAYVEYYYERGKAIVCGGSPVIQAKLVVLVEYECDGYIPQIGSKIYLTEENKSVTISEVVMSDKNECTCIIEETIKNIVNEIPKYIQDKIKIFNEKLIIYSDDPYLTDYKEELYMDAALPLSLINKDLVVMYRSFGVYIDSYGYLSTDIKNYIYDYFIELFGEISYSQILELNKFYKELLDGKSKYIWKHIDKKILFKLFKSKGIKYRISWFDRDKIKIVGSK